MTLYSTGVLDKKETKQKWGALRHYLSASFKLLALLYLCFLAVLFGVRGCLKLVVTH